MNELKCFPYPTILCVQLFGAIIFNYLTILFHNAFSGTLMTITVLTSSFLLFLDIVLTVFSLKWWWNVPLIFNDIGINKHLKTKLYRWDEAVSVSIKNRIRIQYGHLLTIMIVSFSDGRFIRFEVTHFLMNRISELCKDPHFIKMLEKAKKDYFRE